MIMLPKNWLFWLLRTRPGVMALEVNLDAAGGMVMTNAGTIFTFHTQMVNGLNCDRFINE